VWLGDGVGVRGSTPCRRVSGSDSRQDVHTRVPLSPSSITGYRPKGDDALRQWKKAVGGRPPQYMPRPSPPSVGAEALRAAEPTAAPADGNVAVGPHGEYFRRSPLQLPNV